MSRLHIIAPLAFLLALAGCAHDDQAGSRIAANAAARACPVGDQAFWGVPGFSEARELPGGTGTTMDPGMNWSITYYELDVPLAEASAFYERCLGAAAVQRERSVVGVDLPPGAKDLPMCSRYLRLEESRTTLRVVVEDRGCY